MEISSPEFKEDEPIPKKYTCQGDDISPPLEIKDVPAGAQSLVLLVQDPDAAIGTWTHWTMWNIPPQLAMIAEDSVPAGAVQGIPSAGNMGYHGPCPPSGTHHYIFRLYALDSVVDLPSETTVMELEEAMEGRIMDSAELTGIYTRNGQ
jgi:hypothetical protein